MRFRVHQATFRDWRGGHTEFPRKVAEAALAHVIGDKAEKAHRRSDALDKRRKLMSGRGSVSRRANRPTPAVQAQHKLRPKKDAYSYKTRSGEKASNVVAPKLGLESFSCPHCRAMSDQTWFRVFVDANRKDGKPLLINNCAIEDLKRAHIGDEESK